MGTRLAALVYIQKKHENGYIWIMSALINFKDYRSVSIIEGGEDVKVCKGKLLIAYNGHAMPE